jgi:hypothetical protein
MYIAQMRCTGTYNKKKLSSCFKAGLWIRIEISPEPAFCSIWIRIQAKTDLAKKNLFQIIEN